MAIFGKIIKHTYRDSIALMKIANSLLKQNGINKVDVILGTPANIEFLKENNLYFEQIETADSNDIVIVIDANSEENANAVMNFALRAIENPIIQESINHHVAFSVDEAIKTKPNSNLVLISIPGIFVKREAVKALNAGLNLMIFSDNVPIEDEIEIKELARKKDLLVMGPDCGTAYINGIGLAFANHVRRGKIGIVAASGTGLQEIACLIDRSGLGISQGIGTGSRDISYAVGASTLKKGISLLVEDDQTDVIIVVTKPPDERLIDQILTLLWNCKKPVIVNFIGGKLPKVNLQRVFFATTLEDTARLAVETAGGRFLEYSSDLGVLIKERKKMTSAQKYIRGIYSGGTFTLEAGMILSGIFDNVYSNAKLSSIHPLKDSKFSEMHTVIDMGEDEFTRGKPHPMLEPSMRHQRILQEAKDPETAVIIFDVVLGYGVHPNPAEGLLPALVEAKRIAEQNGRYLPMIASVCGTDLDPQIRSKQIEILKSAQVLVYESNAAAVRATSSLISSIQNGKAHGS